MRRVVLAGAVLSVLMFAPAARAIDIAVDNVRGDDLRDGGTGRGVGLESGPVRTIKRALELAHAGDRIVLTPNAEPYRESVTLQGARHRTSEASPLVIDGRGATLDGTEPIPAAAWRGVRQHVFAFEPPLRAYGLLYLDGVPAPRPASRRAADLQPGEATLERGRAWFRLAPEPNFPPGYYDLRWTALPVGLTLYDVRGVEIRNLVVQGYVRDGINLHDNAVDVRLSGVTLRGNGRSGLSAGGASRATLENSHASSNGIAQLRVEGAARLRLRSTEVLDDFAPAVERDGGAIEGDVPVAPRQAKSDFVDRLSRSH